MKMDSGPRRSGRTTMSALHYVHMVLDNPGQKVLINDHGPTLQCDKLLFDLVRDVLNALRVPFESDPRRMTITAFGPPHPYTYPTARECMDSLLEWEEENRTLPSRRGTRYVG